MTSTSLIGAVAAIALVAPTSSQQARPYDLLITNARIIDGTGAPGRTGDIGIRDGRIVRVGRIGAAETAQRIDAGGRVVAPGFIDVHTHADNVASHPQATNFIRMGVTTIVAGNCGSSALDIGPALQRIRDAGTTVNYATLIGHNTVRSAVMGSAQRAPTLDELNKMKALVFRGMAEGAVGFSTGLQYVPGTYANAAEIIELARVAGNEGGLYATHMRNEGTALVEAVTESINVAQLLRIPVQISHLKVDSPSRWGAGATALKLIDDARRRGLDVEADQYAYTAGSSSLSIRFPSWALEGGALKIADRLNDPATWARIKKEMGEMLAERGFMDLSWATVATYRANPMFNGLTMKAVALALTGNETADAQLEAARTLMLGGGASMVYHFMSEADVEVIMKHPMVGVASDAGVIQFDEGVPHPRGYGNTVRVLARYVRERGVITLQEAVRKMTSLPAAQFGFADRGVIREGGVADLVMFDPARVRDVATFEQPHAYPEGMSLVIVNGVVAVSDGQLAGARSGQVIATRKR